MSSPRLSNRRQFVKTAAAVGAAALGFPAIVRAQKAKEIVVGGAAGHKAFLDMVMPKFEKQYGCKIIYEGTRSLVNLEKMVNNKSKPYLSVVLMDDPVMISAIKEDVIEKITPAKVPNMSKLIPGTIHQDGFWVNYVQSTTGVAFNTSKVKALPSWGNLWDAQYKGKIVIPSLQNTEGLALFMMAAALETGKPMKEAQYQIDAAFKKLKALKPNLLTIYTQIPQALNLLEQGEAFMIPGMVAYNAMERKTKGAPVDVLLPKEGQMAMPSGIAKVKNGPDADLSHAFINEIIGAYQKDISETLSAIPTNSTVAAPKNVAKTDVFVPDWAYVSEQRKGWVERWDREMAL